MSYDAYKELLRELSRKELAEEIEKLTAAVTNASTTKVRLAYSQMLAAAKENQARRK